MDLGAGPACFTCRKRRVKCDAHKPACRRCEKDDLVCRGYTRPLKIITFRPSEKHTLRHEPSSENDDTPSPSPPSAQGLTTIRPGNDPDYLKMLEAFRYYDEYVLPHSIPADRPFIRKRVDRQVPWHVLPKLIQHATILAFGSMRSARMSPTLSTTSSLCHYRGLALTELRLHLRDAVSDPDGLALAAVLLLMSADLLLPPYGLWTTHFDAATRLISLRGGFNQAWRTLHGQRSLLINFLVVDIFSGTTCPRAGLLRNAHLYREYAEVLPELAENLIQQAFTCPVSVIQAINTIHILKAASQASEEGWPCNAVTLLENFDSQQWAVSMLGHSERTTPENKDLQADMAALRSLAECYKLAAWLYYLLACPVSHLATLDLSTAVQMLSIYVKYLFAEATDPASGPLHTQLWRFIRWPLFMLAYAQIAWPSAAPDLDYMVVLDWLGAVVTSSESARALKAVDYLVKLQKARSEKLEWAYDDGFPVRCLFGA